MIVTIEQKLPVNPKYLNSNIFQYILEKLRSVMKNKCTLEYGYILKINKIIKLGDNIIKPSNSLIIYNVIYEATTFLPKIGLEIKGTVCMVFEYGILVDLLEKTQVLIPLENMKDYTFKSDSNSFIGKNTKYPVIEGGIEITIIITMVKYEKKKFKCIGKL